MSAIRKSLVNLLNRLRKRVAPPLPPPHPSVTTKKEVERWANDGAKRVFALIF